MHDPFLSMTARYADIVLPAATYLETEDLYRAYGTYYMQYGHRKPSRLRAKRGRTPAGAGAWRRGSGCRTRSSACRRPRCCGEMFCGAAAGRSPRVDPESGAQGRPGQHRTEGRAAVPHAVGQARVLLRDARRAGPAANAGLAARSGRRAPAQPLAVTPADRSRLFPEPHRLFGRRFLRRARGPAVLHPASRRGGARGLARRRAVRLFNDRGAVGLVLQRQRRGAARRRAGSRAAPGRRGRRPGPSTCSAPTATPTWARARPIRALGSTSRPGRGP